MPIALVLITIGALMAYSSIEGVTIADAFAGAIGRKLNPKGTSLADALAPLGNAPNATAPENQVGPSSAGNTAKVDGVTIAGWIAPIVTYARAHGWNGRVQSGVRDVNAQVQACINVCGNPNGCPGTCAAPGTSNHQEIAYPGGAIDVSDPAGFQQAISTYPGGPPIHNDLPNDRGHMSVSGH